MSQPLAPLTLPLHGERLIEASAGTGKTYTIASLYVRLVIGHGGDHAFERPLGPEEILVVTFTRAATSELRERIRTRLRDAAQVFREGPATSSDKFLQALHADVPAEDHALAAWRLETAAGSMDLAGIFTIHSWCQGMLGQHAFDSGSRFRLDVETDESRLQLAVVKDYWRLLIDPLPPLARQSLPAGFESPDHLRAHLKAWWRLPLTATDESLEALLQGPSELESLARAAWRDEAADVWDWLYSAHERGAINRNRLRADNFEAWRSMLDCWAREEIPTLAALPIDKLALGGLAVNKGHQKPDHFRSLALFDELAVAMADFHQHLPCAASTHAACWTRDRLEKIKQQRATLTFDDQVRRLEAALQGSGGQQLARTLATQYPVALVDEFQDTDAWQYQIFRRVYHGQPATGLFLIGDPKQAIYAFRGADIFTYLAARRATPDHYTLDTNFRSSIAMVKAANGFFGFANQHPLKALGCGDAIPFEPVHAHGRNDRWVIDGADAPALTFWQDAVPRTRDQFQRDMARATANEIARLLALSHQGKAGFHRDADGELTPLSPADIAVLVRTGKQAAAMKQALARHGIPSTYLSEKQSVYASTEAHDLLHWLTAMHDCRSERALRVALATPTLNRPLGELDAGQPDDDFWEETMLRFSRYRELWQRVGILPVLREFLSDYAVAHHLLGGARTDGERSLTNLLQLGELLQQASVQLDGPQALLQFLARQVREAEDGDDSSEDTVLRLESDAALVRIVTLHKSKGLEYPLVFLPFVGASRPAAFESGLVTFHDDDGNLHACTDTADAVALQNADRERLQEDLRLLYVGITRACHACWIAATPLGRQLKERYQCDLAKSALGYVLGGGAPLPPERLGTHVMALANACGAALSPPPDVTAEHFANAGPATSDELEPAREAPPPQWRHWRISSYSAMTAHTTSIKGVDVDSGMEENPADGIRHEVRREQSEAVTTREGRMSEHDFPAGPDAGTFLHDLLEAAANDGFDQVAGNAAWLARHLERHDPQSAWAPWRPLLSDWLAAVLTAPLLLPGSPVPVSLATLSPGAYLAEPEFLMASASHTRVLDRLVTEAFLPGHARPPLSDVGLNGMIKGFIDLVFCHAGRYYVADYKSNRLGDSHDAYHPDALGAAMLDHRYDVQLVLYALALHRLLRSRLPDYDYDTHVGGGVYLFLRGMRDGRGLMAWRPGRALVERLDRLFSVAGAVESTS